MIDEPAAISSRLIRQAIPVTASGADLAATLKALNLVHELRNAREDKGPGKKEHGEDKSDDGESDDKKEKGHGGYLPERP